MAVLKKFLSMLLRIAISAGLIIFLFKQVGHENLMEVIGNADKDLLLLALAIYAVSYLLCLYRWQMLLKAVGLCLPLKRVIISFAGGTFFSLFLPSTIGGDLMRSIDLAAHTKKPGEVVATVILDRLSGYIGLVVIALMALSFGWGVLRDSSVALSMAAITGLLIFIMLVLFNRPIYLKINKFLDSPNAGKIKELLKDLHEEIHYFRDKKKIIAGNLIISLAVQAIAPLTFYIIALSLGVKLNLLYFFIFIPIIGAITLLPISIGGLGLRDATTIFFFSKVGVGKDIAFAMSLASFSFIVIYGAIGGLIYVLTVRHRRLQRN